MGDAASDRQGLPAQAGLRLPGWVRRFGAIADRPDSTQGQRLRHRYLILTGVVMSSGGVVWGTILALLGLPLVSSIPYGYTAITAVNMFWLARTKNFAVARAVQVLISLLLPFMLQWSLGGFVTSGCMMIWALLALMCSLSFDDAKATARWTVVYLVLTVFSGYLEGELPVPKLLDGVSLARFSFAINVGTVSTLVSGLTLYFVQLSNKMIQELAHKNDQIAASQQALIQSEKMAALGQLVAGVAHELNTPLGAIRASVGNIQHAMREITETLPTVLRDSDQAEMDGFRTLVAAGSSPHLPTTSRDERAQRKALRDALGQAGIGDAATLADTLVDIGVRDDVEPHLQLLRSPSHSQLVRGAYNVVAMRRNGDSIRIAAERAAKIVFALKSYAHPGAQGAPFEAKLSENLDTVLTLYYNQIKLGVELVRSYDEPGTLLGRHDELNQVWTNLVHNAL